MLELMKEIRVNGLKGVAISNKMNLIAKRNLISQFVVDKKLECTAAQKEDLIAGIIIFSFFIKVLFRWIR